MLEPREAKQHVCGGPAGPTTELIPYYGRSREITTSELLAILTCKVNDGSESFVIGPGMHKANGSVGADVTKPVTY